MATIALPIASLRPPSATRIESTSAFSNARPGFAPNTFRIFPRIGRIACRLASRACFAEPPAESPSTMKSSRSSTGTFGLSSVSASFPGRFESEKIDVAALRSFFEIFDCAIRMSRVSSSAVEHLLRLARVRGEPGAEALVDERLHRALRLGAVQPALRLALELRLDHHHRHRRREAVEHVARLERLALVALQAAGLVRLVVEASRQRPPQSGHVGAAVDRVDDVAERVDALLGAVRPLQRHLDRQLGVAAVPAQRDDGGVHRVALGVQLAHVVGQAGARSGTSAPRRRRRRGTGTSRPRTR